MSFQLWLENHAPFHGLKILWGDAEMQDGQIQQLVPGATGKVAHSAEEMLQLASSGQFNVAIMDRDLETAGLSTDAQMALNHEDVRLFDKLKSVIPNVVIATGFGYDMTHCLVKAKASGLEHTLYKPYRPEQLQAVFQSLIGQTATNTP